MRWQRMQSSDKLPLSDLYLHYVRFALIDEPHMNCFNPRQWREVGATPMSFSGTAAEPLDGSH